MGVVKKWTDKIIAVLIIGTVAVTLREIILTDKAVGTMFSSLMGTLPFAKYIVDAICKVLKCGYVIPVISTASVLEDALKLAIMTLIQPAATMILTYLFLPVPAGSIDAREAYMSSVGYKIKALFVKIVATVPLAFIAAKLSEALFELGRQWFGEIGSMIMGGALTLLAGAVSAIALSVMSVAIGTALLWVFLVDILGKLLTTLATTVCSLGIYVALVRGVSGEVLGYALTLFLMIAGIDIMLGGVKKSLV